MSTQGFIGTLDEHGLLHGRTVCTDGYPSGLGRQLVLLLARLDGDLDTLLSTLLRYEVWGAISARYPAELDPEVYGPKDQFVAVEGFGRAHADGRNRAVKVLFGRLNDATNTEYAWGYFFTTRDPATAELIVTEGAMELARIPVRGLARYVECAAWHEIECGAHYERCSHMAWYHFPEVARGSRLSTATWLGLEPLSARDAVAAVYRGVRYQLTGSGRSGGYTWRSGQPKGRTGVWYAEGRTDTGGEGEIPIYWTKSEKPYQGVTLIYPELAPVGPEA